MRVVVTIPDSTKRSLRARLDTHAQARWPALTEVRLRFRGAFAYIDGVLADGEILPLCRLRYVGSAHHWGFAIYRASHADYHAQLNHELRENYRTLIDYAGPRGVRLALEPLNRYETSVVNTAEQVLD